jgi:hypothetical protein
MVLNNIIFQPPVAFKYSIHSILQSLMQFFVHQFYTSTTCFGHIGQSSGTIAIVAKAVSLKSYFSMCTPIHLLDALFDFYLPLAQVHLTNFSFVRT